MKRLLLALAFTACASSPQTASAQASLDWLSGCWRTADKSYKEVWTKPDAGYFFGYSLTYEAGAVTFFEQARIDPGNPAVFNAYPAGFGPSAFTEDQRAKNFISFANPAHDYPQRITYARDGRRMTATISKDDGSNTQVLEFRRC